MSVIYQSGQLDDDSFHLQEKSNLARGWIRQGDWWVDGKGQKIMQSMFSVDPHTKADFTGGNYNEITQTQLEAKRQESQEIANSARLMDTLTTVAMYGGGALVLGLLVFSRR